VGSVIVDSVPLYSKKGKERFCARNLRRCNVGITDVSKEVKKKSKAIPVTGSEAL
jgi:hypothetical protein